MTETDNAQLQLSPTSLTVKIDGVTISTPTWDKALKLLSQQAAIRRRLINFTICDSDSTEHAVNSINQAEQIQGAVGNPQANVILNQWAIQNAAGQSLITFPTLTAAQKHIQLVADICRASILVNITGTRPDTEFPHTFSPDGITSGSVTELSQTELEDTLLAADLNKPDSETHKKHTENDGEPSAVPNGTAEPNEEPAPAVFLFEDTDQTSEPQKTPLLENLTGYIKTIETPAILMPTRNKFIAGGAVALIGLAAFGLTAPLLSAHDTTATVKLTDTSVSVPVGYAETPLWSINIPEDAQVKATRTATALIGKETLSLYNSDTGEKIRDISLDSPITTFGEVALGEETAVVWRTGNTLQAWTPSTGVDKDLLTVDITSDTALSGSGGNLLVTTPSQTQVLTKDGLKKYTVPADLSAMAATENSIVAGNFSPTVYTLGQDGKATSETTLQVPTEGQSIHSWEHADENITVTIWALNPEATCDSTDKSGCDEDVTVAIHSLHDGSITTSYETKLEAVAGMTWVDGESDLYGGFGPYVIDEKTGQQVTALPKGLKAEKIKGNFTLSTDEQGHTVIFHSDNDGYELTSVLLAQTTSQAILQQGNRIVSYPLASV
ncbi:hypothetical protein [Rothia sp. P4278]|uniref:hypothetical protein n=1 Tax=Rothia sp. P4278 TaxID=3402658 RepID=UPI003AE9528C